MPSNNLPISYDYHGDIPFSVPFGEISPRDIHLYLDLDTYVGKDTCGQRCSHCWFVNYEKVSSKSFSPQEGRLIADALRTQGYRVYPRYVDSFAYGGAFMRLFGPAHSREFRQARDHGRTATMDLGDAWTSGRPLLGDRCFELLELATRSGYGTVSLTFHGLLDEHLNVVRNTKAYPLKGVFPGHECEEVVRQIQAYSSRRSTGQRETASAVQALRINIGVTIGRHNHSREALLRYVRYFNKLKVDAVRFNNFTDHGGRHPELPLSREEVEQVYRDLKWIHENVALSFQLGVSEDFGTFGIQVMGFPSHVGWCRGGHQLFTVIPAQERIVEHTAASLWETIGDVVACVNVFEPCLGHLVRVTRLSDLFVGYEVRFDLEAIEAFTSKRVSGAYEDGCFARELMAEVRPPVTRRAAVALDHRGSSKLSLIEPR